MSRHYHKLPSPPIISWNPENPINLPQGDLKKSSGSDLFKWIPSKCSLSIAKGRIPSQRHSEVQMWLTVSSSINRFLSCPPRQGKWHSGKNPYLPFNLLQTFSLARNVAMLEDLWWPSYYRQITAQCQDHMWYVSGDKELETLSPTGSRIL